MNIVTGVPSCNPATKWDIAIPAVTSVCGDFVDCQVACGRLISTRVASPGVQNNLQVLYSQLKFWEGAKVGL